MSQAALVLYRSLLRQAALLDSKQKASAIEQIKEGFRKNAKETDPHRIQKLIKDGESSLQYLKMITPRIPSAAESSKTGKTVYRVHEGKVVEGSSRLREKRDFVDPRLDPEQFQRHEQLLRRQDEVLSRFVGRPIKR